MTINMWSTDWEELCGIFWTNCRNLTNDPEQMRFDEIDSGRNFNYIWSYIFFMDVITVEFSLSAFYFIIRTKIVSWFMTEFILPSKISHQRKLKIALNVFVCRHLTSLVYTNRQKPFQTCVSEWILIQLIISVWTIMSLND